MRLRYTGKEPIEIRWKGEGASTRFSPEADVREDLGKRLLANEDPKVKGKFIVVEPATEVKTEAKPEKPLKACSRCGKTYKNQGSLNLHMKVHKESP